jgi:pyruvate dehydrogenase E1 component alpha subunit/2-oxoisovalerate dehydrogenase E1 component alpha subunit
VPEKTKATQKNGRQAAGARPKSRLADENGNGRAYGEVTAAPVVVPPRRQMTTGGVALVRDDAGKVIGPWPEGTPPPPLDPKLAAAWTKEQLLDVYRFMRMSREIENKVINLYRQGKISGGVYLGRGNEATAVPALFCLEKDDPVTILHRDLGAHLVRGWTCRDIFMQYYARKDAPNFGKDTGLHLGSLESFSLGTVSPLGCMIPVTLGCAVGLKMQGKNAVGLTFTGDGATSLGDFHEALNFAGVWKAPFILIVENNQFAYSTPTSRQYACERISDRAAGYGMPGTTVDGTDVLKMLSAVRTAVERARAGDGPTLIESVTMRMRGHSEHDDASYVPKGMAEMWAAWDPLKRYEEFLDARGILTGAHLEKMLNDIQAAIEDGVAFAESQPPPSGPEAAEGVYA